MSRFLASTGIAIALVASPAHAQLIGGALGGGIGLPVGTIGGMGDIGVSRVGRTVETTATASAAQSVRAPRVREVTQNADVATSVTGSVSAATRRANAGGTAELAGSAGTSLHGATTSLDGAANVTAPTGSPLRGAVSSVRRSVTRVAVPQVTLPPVPDLAIRRTAIVAGGIAPVPIVEVPAYVERQYVVFEDALEGTGAIVKRQGNQIVIDMPADVTFAFDKSDIRARFIPALNALARTLNQYPATFIDVEGHTDSVGTIDYNQALSERRADAVANYLSRRSVLTGRMHVEGFGELEPKDTNATVDGRAANRRVEIILTPYAA